RVVRVNRHRLDDGRVAAAGPLELQQVRHREDEADEFPCLLREQYQFGAQRRANRGVLGDEVVERDGGVEEVVGERDQRQGVQPPQLLREGGEVDGAQRDAAVGQPAGGFLRARVAEVQVGGERGVILGQRREAGRGEVFRPVVGVVRLQEERRLVAAL